MMVMVVVVVVVVDDGDGDGDDDGYRHPNIVNYACNECSGYVLPKCLCEVYDEAWDIVTVKAANSGMALHEALQTRTCA